MNIVFMKADEAELLFYIITGTLMLFGFSVSIMFVVIYRQLVDIKNKLKISKKL